MVGMHVYNTQFPLWRWRGHTLVMERGRSPAVHNRDTREESDAQRGSRGAPVAAPSKAYVGAQLRERLQLRLLRYCTGHRLLEMCF
jgi:hypothetical protein